VNRRKKIAFAAAFTGIVASATGVAVAQEHGQELGGIPIPYTHDTHPGSAPLAPSRAPGGHGGHGGDAHHGPAPINWTDLGDKHQPAFIALLVNFGLLAGLYYTLGKKPIAQALKQRRVTIGKDIEDAQKMLAEAKERAKKYQGDLKNADADAEAARNALVAAGKGEVDRILIEAKEKAERMKRDADRLVEQEQKQIHQDLLIETIELAASEAEKILARSVTPEDHARLAHDLLAELARRPAAARTGGAS
jgi:F0F1-type ATP synthase membrane subunit b/b'